MTSKEEFFVNSLLDWYKKNGRSFPWREKGTSVYQILVVEQMLKKTRAENVTASYLKFISKYSSPEDVNKASGDDLREILEPLGLVNQRVKAVKAIFAVIEEHYNGEIPDSRDELLKIPYVGLYTANAVLCFGYNKDLPLVDVNILRICERFFNLEVYGDIREDKHVWELLENIIPKGKGKEFNYALLDFGSEICKSRNPDHSRCVLYEKCEFCKKEFY